MPFYPVLGTRLEIVFQLHGYLNLLFGEFILVNKVVPNFKVIFLEDKVLEQSLLLEYLLVVSSRLPDNS